MSLPQGEHVDGRPLLVALKQSLVEMDAIPVVRVLILQATG
jgi:hypothetical protein